MDVGSADLGTGCERDADDVCDVARHEPPRDDPAFALGDWRAGPDGGHFRQAVDLELRHREINPGALHEAKALDPIPWPNELRLYDRQVVPHDQERHPRPFALQRLRELIKTLPRKRASVRWHVFIHASDSLQEFHDSVATVFPRHLEGVHVVEIGITYRRVNATVD